MKKYKVEIYLSFCAIVLMAVLLRLIPHVPNVAPIAALALFSGIVIPSIWAFFIPLGAMIISDFFLGYHSTIPFVYGSFLLIALIGYILRKDNSPLKVGLGSLTGSFLFFIITNFGVWMTSSMYEKTFNGLLHCYTMGLPFFRNTVVGDIFYTTVFFVSFNCIKLLFVLMSPSHQKWERRVGNTV
jgi:hypothetical protein